MNKTQQQQYQNKQRQTYFRIGFRFDDKRKKTCSNCDSVMVVQFYQPAGQTKCLECGLVDCCSKSISVQGCRSPEMTFRSRASIGGTRREVSIGTTSVNWVKRN